MSEFETSHREYELESDPAPIPWFWLIVTALILWGGAWWLGSQ